MAAPNRRTPRADRTRRTRGGSGGRAGAVWVAGGRTGAGRVTGGAGGRTSSGAFSPTCADCESRIAVIPATIGTRSPDGNLMPDYVPARPREAAPQPPASPRDRGRGGRRRLGRQGLGGTRRRREPNGDGRAVLDGGLEVHAAAMVGDQRRHDRHAEPGAAARPGAGRVRPPEPVEHQGRL